MSTPTLTHDATTEELQHYINGAKSGKGDDMRSHMQKHSRLSDSR